MHCFELILINGLLNRYRFWPITISDLSISVLNKTDQYNFNNIFIILSIKRYIDDVYFWVNLCITRSEDLFSSFLWVDNKPWWAWNNLLQNNLQSSGRAGFKIIRKWNKMMKKIEMRVIDLFITIKIFHRLKMCYQLHTISFNLICFSLSKLQS